MAHDSALDRAIALHQAGRGAEASRLARHFLSLAGSHAGGLHLLGAVAAATGRLEEAAALIGRAVRLDDRRGDGHRNLGLVLLRLGRPREAFDHCRRASLLNAVDPLNAAPLADSAAELAARLPRGSEPRQDRLFRLALVLDPGHRQALVGLGNLSAEAGRLPAALAQFRRLTVIAPAFSRIALNLAGLLRRQNRLEEAIRLNRRVLADCPADPAGHYNLAILLLALGRYQEGWRLYEWRWRTRDFPGPRRGFRQPLWEGEALAGRRLLLHGEQGLGDVLQFCRYAPLAAAAGGRVILEVQAPLVRLLSALPGVERVIAAGGTLPPFDLHCPLLSLPRAFGTSLETVPAAPYLRAPGGPLAAWRRRIGDGRRLAVGLVWGGNAHNPRDHERSVDFSLLAPLWRIPGVRWFSLQLGDRRRDLAGAPFIEDLADGLGDFAETAAAVACLDLVISVDSSVAHLTGGLGRPCWVLLPWAGDWRWLVGRDDSPWYPSLRLFRQPAPGDWPPAVARLASALRRRTSSTAGRQR